MSDKNCLYVVYCKHIIFLVPGNANALSVRGSCRNCSGLSGVISGPSNQNAASRAYNPSNFMLDAKGLDAYYKTLTDQELLRLRADGGFTLEAEQVLDKELARRNLTSDEQSDTSPQNGLIKQKWVRSVSSCLRAARRLLQKLSG